MIPKGKLLIVGGHEDKGEEIEGENLLVHNKRETKSHFEILGALISKIPRAHHIIEIIACASSIPTEMEELYINSFKREGFTSVGIIEIGSVKEANDVNLIKRIQGSHAVFFTGGDQTKLVSLLYNTKLLAAILTKYNVDDKFIVGGTSAGAMAIPEIIIISGLIREALYKDDIELSHGFNLIKEVIVDTHFIKRGRFARLAHAVALNPSCLGIGLGEDTALIISEGNRVECIGSGMVIFINGSDIKSSNALNAEGLVPIVMENLNVSIIAEGSGYLLRERKVFLNSVF